jgi:hypothetical protein
MDRLQTVGDTAQELLLAVLKFLLALGKIVFCFGFGRAHGWFFVVSVDSEWAQEEGVLASDFIRLL